MEDLILDGNFLKDSAGEVVYDLSLKVPSVTIFYFYLGSVLLLMTIITAFILIRKRFKPKMLNMFIGIMTYAMFPYLLNSILTMIVVVAAGDALTGNDVAQVIIAGIFATLSYVLSLYVPVWIGKERVNAPGEAMQCGLGVAIGIAIIPAINFVYNAAIADYINKVGGVIGAFSEEATITEYYDMAKAIEPLVTLPPATYLFAGMSLVFLTCFTIMVSLVIYGIFTKQVPKVWITMPILAYLVLFMLSDIRRVGLASPHLMFVLEILVFAVAMYLVYRLQKKYMGHILKRERVVVRDLRKNRKNKFLR